MPFSRFCSLIAPVLCLISYQFASPALSYADTYSISGIETDHSHFFYDMDALGHVTFLTPYSLHCGGLVSSCYETLTYGANAIYTTDAPTYVSDYAGVGSGCFTTFPQAPCSVGYKGRTLTYSIEPDGLTRVLSVSSGSDPAQALLVNRNLTGNILLSGSGDILFDDGFGDIWYEAINLTTAATPEPASLVLLLTGLTGAGVLYHRRRVLV